jgi:cytochrome c oxidase assembly factor CtaG
LLAAQSLTFAVVGGWYWSELVESAPIVPRTRGAVRAGLAVVPMWAIWVIAYFIGFARSTWFPAFTHGGSAISRVADQQLGTGVLWFISAGVFLPVIFVNFLRFLSDEQHPAAHEKTMCHGPQTRRSLTELS